MTIRRTPQDFVVHELLSQSVRQSLSIARTPEAPLAMYELTKTSLTTPQAVQSLAKSLGIKPGDLSYAGLKDKHAHTVQHLAARPPKNSQPSLPDHAQGKGWSAARIGWTCAELSAASIDGNRFTIVVRDLSRQTNREMDRRARLLSQHDDQATLVIVNYFGDQRFGSARHGRGWIAEHLVKDDFEQALRLSIATPARKDSGTQRAFTRLAATKWGDWKTLAAELPGGPDRRAIEALAQGKSFRDAFASLPYFFQQLCVEAYQSHLWNELAVAFVRARVRINDPPSIIESDDPFGTMYFPIAARIDPAWRHLEAPMVGQDTVPVPPFDVLVHEALTRRGIELRQLRVPGLRRPAFGHALRPLFAAVTQFTMSRAEPDDLGRPNRLKRTLTFDLPRGAYATVVLRALGQ